MGAMRQARFCNVYSVCENNSAAFSRFLVSPIPDKSTFVLAGIMSSNCFLFLHRFFKILGFFDKESDFVQESFFQRGSIVSLFESDCTIHWRFLTTERTTRWIRDCSLLSHEYFTFKKLKQTSQSRKSPDSRFCHSVSWFCPFLFLTKKKDTTKLQERGWTQLDSILDSQNISPLDPWRKSKTCCQLGFPRTWRAAAEKNASRKNNQLHSGTPDPIEGNKKLSSSIGFGLSKY